MPNYERQIKLDLSSHDWVRCKQLIDFIPPSKNIIFIKSYSLDGTTFSSGKIRVNKIIKIL